MRKSKHNMVSSQEAKLWIKTSQSKISCHNRDKIKDRLKNTSKMLGDLGFDYKEHFYDHTVSRLPSPGKEK